ncbi:catalase/peroxidase HPI [Epibacterium ulvae]|uniref:catalase/peroxidase HPI n=1 Tax=Epibacterium ulvae TaxID=1156985 RepID=UPI00248FF82F|nr:catalase/peroxidase HPI [Epibacterium ulvae]
MRLSLKCLILTTTTALVGVAAHATSPGISPEHTRDIRKNEFWWPQQVDLSRLRQNAYDADPIGDQFDYADAFLSLDLDSVKADIESVLTTSQDWWPADYGNYAGLFIRMAWHSAGTYRSGDGRGGANGGQTRFEPLNSWPDNGNLDKARRLLWPVKQKYGHAISWSDLIVLAGNVALENSGFETFGFAGGRIDAWEPELVYWGPETKFLTSDKRYSEDRELEEPLAAAELGLIYVNPQGPEGNPDILASAKDIRVTFGRMGMNDEETAALIVGGHTLGKAHGAHKPEECVGAEPAAEGVEAQGLGWKNKCGTGHGPDAVTSGLEGAWTATPVTWSNNFVDNLYNFEWKKTKSPAGAIQWIPTDDELKFVPDAFDPEILHAPIMLTTDLAMRFDPEYGKVTAKFYDDPDYMNDAFARAWFKLTHRDMGPKARYLGSEVPDEDLLWQDPLPAAESEGINSNDIAALKAEIRNAKIPGSDLVRTAWASAVTFRDTDLRGGANGARLRLAPQKDWKVNDPAVLSPVLEELEAIQAKFNTGARDVSLADLIVLGGAVAIEDAAKAAGHMITVPFHPGRVDATQEQTDTVAFEFLRPAADGFRNYYSDQARLSPAKMLIDRADMLTLTVPEMTVLVAGMRVLDANTDNSKHGVFTDRPGTLSSDFFTNLLDLSTEWTKEQDGFFTGTDRTSGAQKWTATEVDLIFGSNAELRAVAEVYAYNSGEDQFVSDFVDAWTKVMMLDRFDHR